MGMVSNPSDNRKPREALDGAVPAARYRPSEHPYPEALPPLEYQTTFVRIAA